MADRYPMASEQPRPRMDIASMKRAQDIADAAQGADTFKGDLVADEQARALALKMMMAQKAQQPMEMNLPLTKEQAGGMPDMGLQLSAKRGAALKKYASLK